jgi:DNA-directed RNA polymerase specialized sigma24 family protein
LKVFSRITDFDRTRDGVSWAFGIASYEIMTYRRQAQRRREVPAEQLDERVSGAPTPEEVAVAENLQGALTEVLGTLTQADREVLADAPVGPDVAPATWRKRRQRALDRLRAAWSRRHA